MVLRSALLVSAAAIVIAGCKKNPEPSSGPDGGSPAASGSAAVGVGSPSSSVAPAPDDGGPEYQRACYAYGKARCMKKNSCSKLGAELADGPYLTCLSRTTTACLHEYAPKNGTVTPTAVDACAKAWETATCADVKKTTTLKGCEHAPGKTAEGKVCTFDAECATQFCGRPANAACGKCESLPKAGDACKDERCGDDPSVACVDKKCVKRAAKDGACTASAGCDAGLVCHAGKCVAAGVAGAKCDPEGKTAPACDTAEGLGCDRASGTCKPLALANPNDPCDPAGGKLCRGDAVCKANKCVALVKHDAACSDAASSCFPPFRCTDGRCRMPDPEHCL